MILIPSSGKGELPALMEATILGIFFKDGIRSCEKGEEGGGRRASIQAW